MKHALPALEFAPDALAPFLSDETFSHHHGKHHKGYVDKLNALVKDTEFEPLTLTEVVKNSDGALFNNAAQHYNHSFYWRCITPGGLTRPEGELLQEIERDFGSLEKLQQDFASAAKSHFGSGWCWIVNDAQGRLRVRTSSDADGPLTDGESPVLTCDVWEHAYYIDYRNDRGGYVDAFWKAANWDFASLAFSAPEQIEQTILGR